MISHKTIPSFIKHYANCLHASKPESVHGLQPSISRQISESIVASITKNSLCGNHYPYLRKGSLIYPVLLMYLQCSHLLTKLGISHLRRFDDTSDLTNIASRAHLFYNSGFIVFEYLQPLVARKGLPPLHHPSANMMKDIYDIHRLPKSISNLRPRSGTFINSIHIG